MMWSGFYAGGGWGMFPTTILGLLLVASGVLFLLRPQRRYVALVLALGVATAGSGLLSCTVGVVNTLHHLQEVPSAEQFGVLAIGCAESMHNVVLALILIVLAALLASVGAFRASRTAPPTSVAD